MSKLNMHCRFGLLYMTKLPTLLFLIIKCHITLYYKILLHFIITYYMIIILYTTLWKLVIPPQGSLTLGYKENKDNDHIEFK